MHFEISHDEHRERYRRLQEAMASAGIDTLLSWSPENVYYMTGYDTLGYYFPQCFIASVDSEPSLVVRHFESPNVERQTWLQRYVGYRDHEDVGEVVATEAARFGKTRRHGIADVVGVAGDRHAASPNCSATGYHRSTGWSRRCAS